MQLHLALNHRCLHHVDSCNHCIFHRIKETP